MVIHVTTSLVRSGLLLVALVGALWAQESDMPLGDVVKLPRPARRAARVITDDDMPQHPPVAAPAASTTGPLEHGADGKTKAAAAAAVKNQLLQERIADLKGAEAAEEQLASRVEQKLKEEIESLSPQQRQSLLDGLKESQTKLELYRRQRITLEDLAAEPTTGERQTITDSKSEQVLQPLQRNEGNTSERSVVAEPQDKPKAVN